MKTDSVESGPSARALKRVKLDKIPEVTWKLLLEGVQRAKSPLHTVCLGSVGESGPCLRTVVLRQCVPDDRLIACHTDARSGKVSEVRSEPAVCWVFYDRERRLQIRLSGQASVHTDDAFADDCWARTRAGGRACYNTDIASGSQLDEPFRAPARIATPEQESEARSHFAVISCRIDFLDWLVLSATGHRRARFHWSDGRWNGAWISP